MRFACLDFSTQELLETYRYCQTMAFFEAYFDESGTHDGALVTVVAGVIGKRSAWLSIEGQWRSVLRKFAVSSFHATDLSTFHEEYEDWDESKRRMFVSLLLRIISSESLIPIAIGVYKDVFDKVSAEYPELVVTPYQMCCEWCAARVSRIAMQKKRMSPIALIYEAGQKANSVAMMHMLSRFHDPAFRDLFGIRQVSFLSKEGVIPLEVADFMAYEHYRGLSGPEIDTTKSMRYPLVRLLEEFGVPSGGVATEDGVRRHFEFVKKWTMLKHDDP